MKLNSSNYFSKEAMQEYFSVSQYKDFVGSLGRKGCEAMALAKMRGEWEMEMTTPLLVGSYVDAHFEGTLDVFKAQHPEILKKDRSLLSTYVQADDIIARIERDPYFMKYMDGEKQRIFTGEIFGVKWKCKIDSLDPNVHITDLKIMREIRKAHWVRDYGHMSFIQFWGYDLQAAIYQEIVAQNIQATLPFFIAAASKEKVTDIEIIGFTQQELDDVLSTIEPNIKRIVQLKKGEVEPDRCGSCDYCKLTKVLTKPIHHSLLLLDI